MGSNEMVTVLAVTPLSEDQSALEQIFGHSRWNFRICHTCAEASELVKGKAASVVLCEENLPDGDWKNMLEQTEQVPEPPVLIVTSRLADERLWSEVLHRGAYDLLSKPFRSSEVFRTVTMAHIQWNSRRKSPEMPAPARMARGGSNSDY